MHTKPFIQFAKRPGDFCDAKIVGVSSYDRIEISEDSLDIPPLIVPGHESEKSGMPYPCDEARIKAIIGEPR